TEDTRNLYAWDNHIIATVSSSLPHCKEVLYEYLQRDLVCKYEQRRIEELYYYIGYDEDDLILEIDYGQKIRNCCEEVKSKKLSYILPNVLSSLYNTRDSIQFQIEKNNKKYNKSWYGGQVYLQKNKNFQESKKAIEKRIELKKKQEEKKI